MFSFLWVVCIWDFNLGPGLKVHGDIVAILVGKVYVSNNIFNYILVSSGFINPIYEYSITGGLTADDELWFLLSHVYRLLSMTPPYLGP